MFNQKKIHGTDDEVKAEILNLRIKEYLSNKPQIETGFLIHEYIDNYLELCRLRRMKNRLNKEEHVRLLELQRIEVKMPACLINEFKKYLIESDTDSKDTLDKIVKRIKE